MWIQAIEALVRWAVEWLRMLLVLAPFWIREHRAEALLALLIGVLLVLVVYVLFRDKEPA